jgi:hypothetical protein
VTRIATVAMTSGSTASAEPNNTNSTTSAPNPAIRVSASRPGPDASPDCVNSASVPVSRTGSPATVAVRSASVNLGNDAA